MLSNKGNTNSDSDDEAMIIHYVLFGTAQSNTSMDYAPRHLQSNKFSSSNTLVGTFTDVARRSKERKENVSDSSDKKVEKKKGALSNREMHCVLQNWQSMTHLPLTKSR